MSNPAACFFLLFISTLSPCLEHKRIKQKKTERKKDAVRSQYETNHYLEEMGTGEKKHICTHGCIDKKVRGIELGVITSTSQFVCWAGYNVCSDLVLTHFRRRKIPKPHSDKNAECASTGGRIQKMHSTSYKATSISGFIMGIFNDDRCASMYNWVGKSKDQDLGKMKRTDNSCTLPNLRLRNFVCEPYTLHVYLSSPM